MLQFDGFFVTSQNTQNLHFNLTIFFYEENLRKTKKLLKIATMVTLFLLKTFELITLGGGNAPVTRVTKEILSHLRISQQFFKALTDPSRVLKADVALA